MIGGKIYALDIESGMVRTVKKKAKMLKLDNVVLQYGLTIFSANSVNSDAETLCRVKSTGRSLSVKGAVFLIMPDHSGSAICRLPLKREVQKQHCPTRERGQLK